MDLASWLKVAQEAYTASTTYFDANIRTQIEKDLRAFQSLHPPGSKYLSQNYASRSRIYRPKTRAAIRRNEAVAAEAFFSTNDVVSVLPVDESNDEHRASAELMKALLQYRLTKSVPWFLTLIGAYQDAMSVGVVASYQAWEYNEKRKIDRPICKLQAVENIRFDQGADWTDVVESSPYLIRLMPMYVRDVQSRMKLIDPKTGEPKWFPLPDETIIRSVKGYGDSIRMTREGNRQDSQESRGGDVNGFSIAWVHQNFLRVGDDDWVFYTLGTDEMLSKPVPIEEVYWHGKRPVVVGCAVLETHKVYPSSIAQLGHQTQTEINEIANQRIDNVKFVLNKRYFVQRNRQVDLRSLTRNVPGSATLMQDVEKDVKVVETQDVSRSSYEEQDRLNVDFDDIVGGFSQSSVQSNKNLNETVGGLNILNANANQVTGYQLRTFVETWVEPVLRQLVLLEQAYETDEVVLATAGTQARLERFGVSEVTDDLLTKELTVTVNVGIGSTSPTQQVAQFLYAMKSLRDILVEGALDRYGLNIEEVVKELFGKLGYRDGGRFFQWDGIDPQLAAAQKTIEELQQALDQKFPPELLAAQIRKLEADIKLIEAKKVGQGVDSAYSAMQAAEVIAAIPQVAPVADEVMKGAGYVAPSPPGIDPNFPIAETPAVTMAAAQAPPQAAGGPVGAPPGVMGHSPNPMNPTPPPGPSSPGMGRMEGIQSQTDTGVQNLRLGGLVDDEMAASRAGLAQGLRGQGSVSSQIRAPIGGVAATVIPKLPSSQGAIDMSRPALANDDGTFSTERTITVEADGRHFLIPTIVNGKQMSPEAATSLWQRGMNEHVGDFGSAEEAEAAAIERSNRIGMERGFAEGGMVRGPGTGTSDSIPAVTENGAPVRVSNGEFVIPADVVAKLGVEFFEDLIEGVKDDDDD